MDQATESALNGETVWSKLREDDRAVGRGEFTGKALVANLDARDYGIPLDEVRNRFWQTVRKPLLWSGEPSHRNDTTGWEDVAPGVSEVRRGCGRRDAISSHVGTGVPTALSDQQVAGANAALFAPNDGDALAAAAKGLIPLYEVSTQALAVDED